MRCGIIAMKKISTKDKRTMQVFKSSVATVKPDTTTNTIHFYLKNNKSDL